MIENYNQYKITKQKLVEFTESLEHTLQNPHANDLKYKITIDSLNVFIERFKKDIAQYEHKYPGQKI
jgi:hypothetical protein